MKRILYDFSHLKLDVCVHTQDLKEYVKLSQKWERGRKEGMEGEREKEKSERKMGRSLYSQNYICAFVKNKTVKNEIAYDYDDIFCFLHF